MITIRITGPISRTPRIPSGRDGAGPRRHCSIGCAAAWGTPGSGWPSVSAWAFNARHPHHLSDPARQGGAVAPAPAFGSQGRSADVGSHFRESPCTGPFRPRRVHCNAWAASGVAQHCRCGSGGYLGPSLPGPPDMEPRLRTCLSSRTAPSAPC